MQQPAENPIASAIRLLIAAFSVLIFSKMKFITESVASVMNKAKMNVSRFPCFMCFSFMFDMVWFICNNNTVSERGEKSPCSFSCEVLI